MRVCLWWGLVWVAQICGVGGKRRRDAGATGALRKTVGGLRAGWERVDGETGRYAKLTRGLLLSAAEAMREKWWKVRAAYTRSPYRWQHC
jgi:hypothetical protein